MTASSRLLTLALITSCVPPLAGARADLSVNLPARPGSVRSPAMPAAQPEAPPPAGSTPVTPDPRAEARGATAYRQVGVVRRGTPVLPPVGGVALPTPAAPAPEIPVNARLGRMLAPATDVFRLPDPTSAWVGKLRQSQQVAVVSQWQGWYAIVMEDGSQAYVPQTRVELLPYQVKTVAPSFGRPAVAASRVNSPGEGTPAVIREALRYQGTTYVYGGNSESGIDCSGLVQQCFAACGVRLPRRASEQAQIGTPVSLDQLQPGDRLYFSVKRANDHTGIYVGGGYFIHASLGRGKVTVDPLSIPLYGKNLTSARRL